MGCFCSYLLPRQDGGTSIKDNRKFLPFFCVTLYLGTPSSDTSINSKHDLGVGTDSGMKKLPIELPPSLQGPAEAAAGGLRGGAGVRAPGAAVGGARARGQVHLPEGVAEHLQVSL